MQGHPHPTQGPMTPDQWRLFRALTKRQIRAARLHAIVAAGGMKGA